MQGGPHLSLGHPPQQGAGLRELAALLVSRGRIKYVGAPRRAAAYFVVVVLYMVSSSTEYQYVVLILMML